jgi:ABC-type uncharacterized transport system permease subunit
MDTLILQELVFAVMRFAAPLMLAAMAGMFSERSGVIQISLEGLMLWGAFSAAAGAHFLHHGIYGVLIAAAVGVVVGLFYGWLVIKLRADQIVAGTAINMLAWGGIPVVCKILFDVSSNTPALDVSERLSPSVPVFFALVVVLVSWFIVSKTPFGLWLTFAGEKPEALRAAGVSPLKVRWVAMMLTGAVASLGGAILSISLASGYTRNMTAGRGFMALAALILGKWRPISAMWACLLFGVFDVLQMKLQGASLPVIGVIPVQLVQVLPYLLTLVILAGVVGESRAPAQLGRST